MIRTVYFCTDQSMKLHIEQYTNLPIPFTAPDNNTREEKNGVDETK